jgi:hypothetical protein
LCAAFGRTLLIQHAQSERALFTRCTQGMGAFSAGQAAQPRQLAMKLFVDCADGVTIGSTFRIRCRYIAALLPRDRRDQKPDGLAVEFLRNARLGCRRRRGQARGGRGPTVTRQESVGEQIGFLGLRFGRTRFWGRRRADQPVG